MSSTDYQLAAALVAAIGATLPSRTVRLIGDPRADRKSITALEIVVRPAAWDQTEDSRENESDSRDVHVAVVGPCHAADLSTLDAYLAVCDEVRAMWGPDGALRDATLVGHKWDGELRQSPLWNDELLLSQNLFCGVIAVKFRTEY